RREPHGLTDLAHGGRVPPFARLLVGELQDLALACGERGVGHRRSLSRFESLDTVHLFDLNDERLFGARMLSERAFRVKHPRGEQAPEPTTSANGRSSPAPR